MIKRDDLIAAVRYQERGLSASNGWPHGMEAIDTELDCVPAFSTYSDAIFSLKWNWAQRYLTGNRASLEEAKLKLVRNVWGSLYGDIIGELCHFEDEIRYMTQDQAAERLREIIKRLEDKD